MQEVEDVDGLGEVVGATYGTAEVVEDASSVVDTDGVAAEDAAPYAAVVLEVHGVLEELEEPLCADTPACAEAISATARVKVAFPNIVGRIFCESIVSSLMEDRRFRGTCAFANAEN